MDSEVVAVEETMESRVHLLPERGKVSHNLGEYDCVDEARLRKEVHRSMRTDVLPELMS